jgi:hypothetical protein
MCEIKERNKKTEWCLCMPLCKTRRVFYALSRWGNDATSSRWDYEMLSIPREWCFCVGLEAFHASWDEEVMVPHQNTRTPFVSRRWCYASDSREWCLYVRYYESIPCSIKMRKWWILIEMRTWITLSVCERLAYSMLSLSLEWCLYVGLEAFYASMCDTRVFYASLSLEWCLYVGLEAFYASMCDTRRVFYASLCDTMRISYSSRWGGDDTSSRWEHGIFSIPRGWWL